MKIFSLSSVIRSNFLGTIAVMRKLTISPTDGNSFENNHTNQRNASTLAVKYV